MGERICTVDDCHRNARTRNAIYCIPHYFRARKGQPLDPPIRTWAYTGGCEVEGCTRIPRGRFCATHYTRFRKYGDPLFTLPRARLVGEANASWAGDAVTYGGIHTRLTNVRGRPGRCARCESADRRCQWAFNWESATEMRIDEKTGFPFSANLDDYIALCLKCHRAFDLSRHQMATIKGGPS